MALRILCFLFLLLCLFERSEAPRSSLFSMKNLPSHTKWALLVAGSTSYVNYRHQADVYHARHILLGNDLRPENIILMAYDDVAFCEQNPHKGALFNRPFGPNVYEPFKADYTGEDVSPSVLLAILNGTINSTRPGPHRKVLQPHPQDTLFVFLSGHGSTHAFFLPNGVLTTNDFVLALNQAAELFSSVLVFIESCYSGSLLASKNTPPLSGNILALTASNFSSDSFACYWDDSLKVFLGDAFSVAWMEDVEKLDTERETLADLHEVAKIETQESNVCLFGNQSFLNVSVDHFMGSRLETHHLNHAMPRMPLSSSPQKALFVNAIDVQLETLFRRAPREPAAARSSPTELEWLLAAHALLEQLFADLHESLMGVVAHERRGKAQQQQPASAVFVCYEKLIDHLSRFCVSPAQVHKAYSYLGQLFEICSKGLPVKWIQVQMSRLCLPFRRALLHR